MSHQPGLFDKRPEPAPQPKLEPAAALVVPPALRELAPSAWAPNANHLDPNPAAVYLASLLPGSSRYTMTRALAQIAAELAGRPAMAKATWNAICLADMGDTGAAFVALPQIPPRNVNWFKKGRWVHLAKLAFEKYFLRKMRKGSAEPIYEKYVLKALGILRLQD